ncbi:heat shock protein 70 family [Mycena rosella]|uniref:Heat shock protein 70 family n=1 Tax=Mycena rosella TaxID=1033263 RepID=A0AAD7GQZ7_MYCRO|nr:heat shock protein 70 family [Mycena rosella]
MPEGTSWLGDVVTGAFFLLGLTVYALRMFPSPGLREARRIPANWEKTGPIIGIDFGTSNLKVGFVLADQRVEIIYGQEGRRAVHSASCSTHDEASIRWANTVALSHKGSTIYETQYTSRSTRNETSSLGGLSSETELLGVHEPCSETAIVAAGLYELRAIAEKLHGRSISQAVIAIPAESDEDARKAMKEAALLAGLGPGQLLDEPVAVAIAYGLDALEKRSHAVVLDVGSAARIALLRIEDGRIQVLASVHNESLGGHAFGQRLFEYGSDAYKASVHDDLSAMQELVLRDQVEIAKLRLSSDEDAVIALPILGGPWFLVPLTRNIFNDITSDLVDDIVLGLVPQLLGRSGVPISAIDHVILAGGSAHIPALKNHVSERFPASVHLSASEAYPEDAVVYGAALFARRLALGQVPVESKIYVQHATPLRFGIEVTGGIFATLIARNSPLPVRNTKRFDLNGRAIRVFTGTAQYTNATELLGSIILPPNMNSTRLKITFDLSTFGVLNVTALDDRGHSHSALIEPRRPSDLEIARMEAEAAALADREDVQRRMQTFRLHFAATQPVLRRHLSGLSDADPQRVLRAQIVDAMDGLDDWMAKHMLSASREQFLGKLAVLEALLKQDVELRANLLAEASGDVVN